MPYDGNILKRYKSLRMKNKNMCIKEHMKTRVDRCNLIILRRDCNISKLKEIVRFLKEIFYCKKIFIE